MPNYSSPITIQNGEVSDASQITTMVQAFEDLINITTLDGENIQDSGITATELASSSITTAKIASEAVTYEKLASAVQALVTPAGTLIAYPSTTPPTGYLYCDGSAVSRTVYSDLFAITGSAFGSGDGSTTFNLPDLRGRFLRGVDSSTGRDPDAASRTAMNSGGNTGDNLGSVQATATAAPSTAITLSTASNHTHTVSVYTGSGASSTIPDYPGNAYPATSSITTATGGAHTHTISGGDDESAPVNAAIAWMVKY